MSSSLPPDMQLRVQALAAEGRNAIERHLSPRPFRANARRLAVLRAIGAMGIGVMAAGLAILVVIVILNLLFHYSPT